MYESEFVMRDTRKQRIMERSVNEWVKACIVMMDGHMLFELPHIGVLGKKNTHQQQQQKVPTKATILLQEHI